MPGGPTRPQPAVLRLKKRREFLAVARGLRNPRRAFVLESLATPDDAAAPVRFGFTVTKKVGNAVERNRIRRRMREAVRLLQADEVAPGDHVMIGRRAALTLPFSELSADLKGALRAARAGKGSERRMLPKASGKPAAVPPPSKRPTDVR